MKKVEIEIKKSDTLTLPCLFCERNAYEYYNVDTTYEDEHIVIGRSRHICSLCYCALKKHFTGVD